MNRLLPELHRDQNLPDWEMIDPAKWNSHQVRAAETNGLDTPGNRATLRGFAASTAALGLIRLDTPASTAIGTGLLFYGRMEDLRDGKIAHETGTKSPKGAALDAGADTVLQIVGMKVLTDTEIVPKAEAVETTILTGVKTVATIVSKARGREPHTSRIGKYQAAASWMGHGLRLTARVAEHFEFEKTAARLQDAGNVTAAMAKHMNRVSTSGYVLSALKPSK